MITQEKTANIRLVRDKASQLFNPHNGLPLLSEKELAAIKDGVVRGVAIVEAPDFSEQTHRGLPSDIPWHLLKIVVPNKTESTTVISGPGRAASLFAKGAASLGVIVSCSILATSSSTPFGAVALAVGSALATFGLLCISYDYGRSCGIRKYLNDE